MKLVDYDLLQQVTRELSEPIILNKYIEFELPPNVTIEGGVPKVENEQYEIKGFTTDPDIQLNSTRYLQSLDLFRTGDTFQLPSGHIYMVTGAVFEKRGAKYKAVAQKTNLEFPIIVTTKKLIGRDPSGKPYYEYTDYVIGITYGIIEFDAYGYVGNTLLVSKDSMSITIRNNEYNRINFNINFEFTYGGRKWIVRGEDFTQDGVIILRAEIKP